MATPEGRRKLCLLPGCSLCKSVRSPFPATPHWTTTLLTYRLVQALGKFDPIGAELSEARDQDRRVSASPGTTAGIGHLHSLSVAATRLMSVSDMRPSQISGRKF